MKITFYADRQDGMGGRLVPILSAARLAGKLGGSFSFCWPKNGAIVHYGKDSLEAAELWSSEVIAESLLQKRIGKTEDIDQYVSRLWKDKGIEYKVIDLERLEKSAPEVVRLNSVNSVYLLPGENIKKVIRENRAWLWNHALRKDLVKMADGFCAKRNPIDYGIHVRMGDVAASINDRFRYFGFKYVPRELFENYLDAKLASVIGKVRKRKVLLCSNSEAVRKDFRNEYGCITFDGKKLTDIQQAVVEILVLSGCKTLCGCSASVFLIAARLIGHAKFQNILGWRKFEGKYLIKFAAWENKNLEREALGFVAYENLRLELEVLKSAAGNEKAARLARKSIEKKFEQARKGMRTFKWEKLLRDLPEKWAARPEEFALLREACAKANIRLM